jgi:hypothetical protein
MLIRYQTPKLPPPYEIQKENAKANQEIVIAKTWPLSEIQMMALLGFVAGLPSKIDAQRKLNWNESNRSQPGLGVAGVRATTFVSNIKEDSISRRNKTALSWACISCTISMMFSAKWGWCSVEPEHRDHLPSGDGGPRSFWKELRIQFWTMHEDVLRRAREYRP